MERIRNVIILLRGQLWILPLILSVLALVLAYWVLASAPSLPDGWDAGKLWWLYSGDAGSARDLLSSLLSGLMTMFSLVISVTFVILTLAANQLGPRLIPTFMGDRQIQTVLGLFLGTILYVLVVLRSLDETLGPNGVPHVAVTIGSALTVVCLFALLFYVHKVARAIVADNIIAQVADDLHRAIRDMLPDDTTADGTVPEVTLPRACIVSLDRSGYIQVIDYDRLVAKACQDNALLKVKVRAGDFVLKGGEHVTVHAARPPGHDVQEAIWSAFVIGEERSPAQDLEFGLRQLVEIALRALSPGINDPYTAIAVVDRLGAALEEILRCPLQPGVLRDADGTARVIARRSDVQGLVDAAFDAIRQAARDIPAVLIRMVDILGQLASVIHPGEARDAVVRHLGRLAETAEEAQLTPYDRKAVLVRIERARIAATSGAKEDNVHVL
ncbi:DUF2254 domain-containing protein [Microvirga sp. 2TAF3]|uniref:DUF2254 domain-containing protein n=1 Tax=Microvirga sp. 2TAF3 TaxID=3233014 RepID=UPI003F98F54C